MKKFKKLNPQEKEALENPANFGLNRSDFYIFFIFLTQNRFYGASKPDLSVTNGKIQQEDLIAKNL